jgi:cell division protein FtsN
MRALPDFINFNVTSKTEGDFIEGLDFIVMPDVSKTTPAIKEALPNKDIDKLTIHSIIGEKKMPVSENYDQQVIHEVIQRISEPATESYFIQMGTFKSKKKALVLEQKLTEALGRPVELFLENGFFKVRISGFGSRKEVDEFIPLLIRNGIKEMWVVTLKGI